MDWVLEVPPSSFFLRNHIRPSRPRFDISIVKKAREAFDLAASKPHIALQKIQDLCNEHIGIALLFQTQAQILEKCYDEALDLDKRSRLMENAIKCTKKAITLSPNSMDFNFFLGYLFYKRSVNFIGFKRAIAQFNTALSIPMPSDPALETLLTDEQIESLGPNYEARVEVARKCILKHIGACLFKLKEIKAFSSFKECLQIVKVNGEEEKLLVAWYSLSVYERRQRLEEHAEGTLHKTAIREARNAYLIVYRRPEFALEQIQELCNEHIRVALLFRTQAEILEKCYDGTTALDKKTDLMENAIRYARKAIELSPNSMNFSSFLGYLFYRTCDYKKAIQQLNSALNILKPCDPAHDILLTDEEIQSICPTYEARVMDARKLILKHIGKCFLKLKELKAYPLVKECLEFVKMNITSEERLRVAWSSLSLYEKRRLLEEHMEGTVRDIAIKKYGGPTGPEEVGRSLKMKEPIGAEEAIGYTEIGVKGKHGSGTDPFEELLCSRCNILILTGEKLLKPDCYIDHIVRLRRPMSKVFQGGPMALVLVADQDVQKIISLFPKDCVAIGLASWSDFTEYDVAVGTPKQFERYLHENPEAEKEVEHTSFVLVNNVDGVFESRPYIIKDIFRMMEFAQFVLVSPLQSRQIAELCSVFSAPWKIVDLQRSRFKGT